MLVTIDLSKLSAKTRTKIAEELEDEVITKIIENYFNELWAKASNVYTKLEILDELSKNEDWRLRLAVASNPKANKQILDRLKNDEIFEVREAAEINFKN